MNIHTTRFPEVRAAERESTAHDCPVDHLPEADLATLTAAQRADYVQYLYDSAGFRDLPDPADYQDCDEYHAGTGDNPQNSSHD
jgi:hypothetical protein